MLIRTASDIGALIRDRRKHQKLGQADLAEMIFVRFAWINRHGADPPTPASSAWPAHSQRLPSCTRRGGGEYRVDGSPRPIF